MTTPAWTSEPRTPGWYWYQPLNRSLEAQVLKVELDLGYLIAWECGDDLSTAVDDLTGDWYGPLETPTTPS